MKLHLGCYQKKIHGYVNVDIRPEVQPDLVDDVFTLERVQSESADVIYACHVLEHATRQVALQALSRWHQVLKSGGTLRLAVPDMRAVCEYYVNHGDLKELSAFFWGSQKHEHDIHYTGWDFETLQQDLVAIGFENIRRYDWRETEHFYVDDYSQCYMPRMSYKTRRPDGEIAGTLLSLNVEAKKRVITYV